MSSWFCSADETRCRWLRPAGYNARRFRQANLACSDAMENHSLKQLGSAPSAKRLPKLYGFQRLNLCMTDGKLRVSALGVSSAQ